MTLCSPLLAFGWDFAFVCSLRSVHWLYFFVCFNKSCSVLIQIVWKDRILWFLELAIVILFVQFPQVIIAKLYVIISHYAIQRRLTHNLFSYTHSASLDCISSKWNTNLYSSFADGLSVFQENFFPPPLRIISFHPLLGVSLCSQSCHGDTVFLAFCCGGSNRNHVNLAGSISVLGNWKIFFFFFFNFLDPLKIIIKNSSIFWAFTLFS